MKLEQFKKIVNDLLKLDYGIDINDAGLADKELNEYLEAGDRPFQAVNQHAEKYGLERTGMMRGWGALGLLTEEDEVAIMSQHGKFASGDQPITCSVCGTRSDFKELGKDLEHHRCLNATCDFEFIVEHDQEDDELTLPCPKCEGESISQGIRGGLVLFRCQDNRCDYEFDKDAA